MNVFLLTEHVDYEGSQVLGVFATREKAQATPLPFAYPWGRVQADGSQIAKVRGLSSTRYTITVWEIS